MAIGHIAVRVHSRSKGHSVAAAVAYRTGTAIVDQRTGVLHDFSGRTKRDHIVDTGLVGDGQFADLSTYAGAVELADTRRNSCILRDVQVALPCELTSTQGVALTEEFAQLLADRITRSAAGRHIGRTAAATSGMITVTSSCPRARSTRRARGSGRSSAFWTTARPARPRSRRSASCGRAWPTTTSRAPGRTRGSTLADATTRRRRWGRAARRSSGTRLPSGARCSSVSRSRRW